LQDRGRLVLGFLTHQDYPAYWLQPLSFKVGSNPSKPLPASCHATPARWLDSLNLKAAMARGDLAQSAGRE